MSNEEQEIKPAPREGDWFWSLEKTGENQWCGTWVTNSSDPQPPIPPSKPPQ